MKKFEFRKIREEELKIGCAVWFEGQNFLDTNISHPYKEGGPVCGPFLIERVLYGYESQAYLVNPTTGDRRSMMYSWLLIPKEMKNEIEQ